MKAMKLIDNQKQTQTSSNPVPKKITSNNVNQQRSKTQTQDIFESISNSILKQSPLKYLKASPLTFQSSQNHKAPKNISLASVNSLSRTLNTTYPNPQQATLPFLKNNSKNKNSNSFALTNQSLHHSPSKRNLSQLLQQTSLQQEQKQKCSDFDHLNNADAKLSKAIEHQENFYKYWKSKAKQYQQENFALAKTNSELHKQIQNLQKQKQLLASSSSNSQTQKHNSYGIIQINSDLGNIINIRRPQSQSSQLQTQMEQEISKYKEMLTKKEETIQKQNQTIRQLEQYRYENECLKRIIEKLQRKIHRGQSQRLEKNGDDCQLVQIKNHSSHRDSQNMKFGQVRQDDCQKETDDDYRSCRVKHNFSIKDDKKQHEVHKKLSLNPNFNRGHPSHPYGSRKYTDEYPS